MQACFRNFKLFLKMLTFIILFLFKNKIIYFYYISLYVSILVIAVKYARGFVSTILEYKYSVYFEKKAIGAKDYVWYCQISALNFN